VSAIQGQLLASGAHFEPTGSDANGPAIEVCDACRCDVTWNPGLCSTPRIHRWTDPGAEPGEEIAP
jgi:hypothetical protein